MLNVTTWPDPASDPRLKDEGLKRRYAAEMLRRPNEEFRVLWDLFVKGPEDSYGISVSVLARTQWIGDAIIVNETRRLQNEHGEAANLPTKETVMIEILALARADKHTIPDRLKAYAQYSDMMGYTGRNTQAPAVGVYANKVMLVKDHGNIENWEVKARAQQEKLVADARADAERATLQ